MKKLILLSLLFGLILIVSGCASMPQGSFVNPDIVSYKGNKETIFNNTTKSKIVIDTSTGYIITYIKGCQTEHLFVVPLLQTYHNLTCKSKNIIINGKIIGR